MLSSYVVLCKLDIRLWVGLNFLDILLDLWAVLDEGDDDLVPMGPIQGWHSVAEASALLGVELPSPLGVVGDNPDNLADCWLQENHPAFLGMLET